MRGWRLTVLALGTVLGLGACSGGDEGGDAGNDDEPGGAATEAAAEIPVPTLALPDAEAAFDAPLTIAVEDGSLTSAEVEPADGGDPLDGSVAGAEWVSSSPPLPGLTYEVSASATDEAGDEHELSGTVTVAEVPDDQRLTLNVIRGGGEIVGVGTPIIVRFEQEVADREAVESAMHVSSDPQVVGAWHWVRSDEVHFRPQEYWPAGTKIRADFELNGVRAGEDLWGGRSYSYEIEVGEEQIARVDASTHTMAVIRDGETIATWDTSLGKPDFATRNGTYIVLSKDRERNMTSCGANITCDEADPAYYDVDAEFAVRLTNSGTFVHSAPWSETSQGAENVSHGCINLSESNAETYYEAAQYGDIVEVVNSSREADDLVERADPGMVDWNKSWSDWVAGSALGEEFTTDPL